jgi:hypothetical protein
MDTIKCGFCGSMDEDKLGFCSYCGGACCDHCPPVCCEELIGSYVDYWLQGLAEVELERL